MARTTAKQVMGIVETDRETWPDLNPFIGLANELVTELCTHSGYSDGRLEYIERLLAAHFYAISDKEARKTAEKVDTIQDSYSYKADLRLQATQYGQQALVLDTAGNLAALNNTLGIKKRRKRSVDWLGTDSEGECCYE